MAGYSVSGWEYGVKSIELLLVLSDDKGCEEEVCTDRRSHEEETMNNKANPNYMMLVALSIFLGEKYSADVGTRR